MTVDGILLVDKPAGWTSHDVVAKVRRIIGERRAGHSGTLDPMATGLLVICFGQATRVVEHLVGHEKAYAGVITLGTRTETDDAEGRVIDERPVPAVDEGVLRELERRFRGRQEQRPPAYSAIKVQGRRSYDLARAGRAQELAPRVVTVTDLRLARVDERRLEIVVRCSAGTYVRSLARDIGEALGCGGHLSALRRTAAGHFDVEGAVTLEGLAETVSEGRLGEVLRPLDEGVVDLDVALVSEGTAERIARGIRPALREAPLRTARHARVYSRSGAFVALARVEADVLVPEKVFLSGER